MLTLRNEAWWESVLFTQESVGYCGEGGSMTLRIWSFSTLGLLVVYFVLRGLAAQCQGAQCDNYILPSLAVPLASVLAAAVTGTLALAAARRAGAARMWFTILATCLVAGVGGSLASAFVFRDSPDIFVPVATALVLLIPLSALAFSFWSTGDNRGALS